MPRPDKRRINNLEVRPATAPQVDPSVVASPVSVTDTGGYNPANDMVGALLRGLGEINPGLKALADQEVQIQRSQKLELMREEERKQEAAGTASGLSGTAPPQEATVAFMRGHMAGAGTRAGTADGQEFQAAYMQARNAPEFNYQDFSDKYWDQKSKDLGNTDADYA